MKGRENMFLIKLFVVGICLVMLGTGALNLYNIVQFKNGKISGEKCFGKELWLKIKKKLIRNYNKGCNKNLIF